MKAWHFQSSSGPMESNLSLNHSVPLPTLPPTSLLIENHSTAVNAIDYKILEMGLITRLAFRSPITPGMDICGRIVQLGTATSTDFKIGDIVYGFVAPGSTHGGLAEYVPVPQDAVVKVPDGLSADDMVAIATVGSTTYASIAPYVKPGSHVFINGGSGGTGVVAIQIAKALGCHVTTSTSSANIALCESLGADTVLDYTSPKAGIVAQIKDLGAMFDLVVDNVGAPADLYSASTAFLRAEGKYVQVGAAISVSGILQLWGNMLRSLFRVGSRRFVFAQAEAKGENLEQLAKWMVEGKLRAVVDSTFVFEDAPKAYEKLKTGRAKGKIVVHVKEE
jgi:NADPH:quinone reductase-like Zn-dependent oxidoreductase